MNRSKITRREKQVIGVAAFMAIAFLIARPPLEFIKDWEWLFLIVVVGPLGFYIATDPERRNEV